MFESYVDAFTRSYLNPRIDKMLRATGEAMQAEARRLCPVKTGQLRDSIGYVYEVSTKTVKLYADKSYASFLEFGYHARNGRIMPARPFLRPATRAAGRIWGGTIEIQLPGLHEKYQAKTVRYAATQKLQRARRITVGHGKFR